MDIVISASRRTDLVAYYPQYLIETLSNYNNSCVHTLVLWTKNPENLMVNEELRSILKKFDSLFLHLTITGLGNSFLEPNIPSVNKMFEWLPYLIGFFRSPDMIRIRFDPIVNLIGNGKWEIGNGKWKIGNKKCYTNLYFFENLCNVLKRDSLFNVTTSWVTNYPKVIRRLLKKGILIPEFDIDEQRRYIEGVANSYGVNIHYCAMTGLPMSSCIDGKFLNEVHPKGKVCSEKKAVDQRVTCGCTESKDIGSYSLKCKGECLYCYAIP